MVSLVVVRAVSWRNGPALALLWGAASLKRAAPQRCLLLRLGAIQAHLLGRLCLHDKGLQPTLNTFPHTGQRAAPCPEKQCPLSPAFTQTSDFLFRKAFSMQNVCSTGSTLRGTPFKGNTFHPHTHTHITLMRQ